MSRKIITLSWILWLKNTLRLPSLIASGREIQDRKPPIFLKRKSPLLPPHPLVHLSIKKELENFSSGWCTAVGIRKGPVCGELDKSCNMTNEAVGGWVGGRLEGGPSPPTPWPAAAAAPPPLKPPHPSASCSSSTTSCSFLAALRFTTLISSS